ncbi:MAG: hypothetical protein ACRDND_18365 [Streptosporangiaceae bacterium]
MPHGSADQPKSAGQVNVYWRRRVIALVAGLGMLALVTWTVNGALGGGSTRPTTDLSQTTGHHSAPPAPGSASATPGTGASGTGATPSPTGKPTPTPSSSATHHAAARHRPHPAGRRGKKAAAAGACSGANLVLSLSSARYSYPAHARPQFDVSVVSTARGRCTADLGAARLHVLIRAGGKTRVWDSADCARSAARQATTLARGVPAVVQFTWNRATSAPSCRPPHRAARPGTYTATAYSGNRSSQAMIFVLKGRGIAVP